MSLKLLGPSESLIGRESCCAELERIVQSCYEHRNDKGATFLAISGKAGMGKSSLVDSLLLNPRLRLQRDQSTTLTLLAGYGKFDGQVQSSPFAAIGTALDLLIRRWIQTKEGQNSLDAFFQDKSNAEYVPFLEKLIPVLGKRKQKDKTIIEGGGVGRESFNYNFQKLEAGIYRLLRQILMTSHPTLLVVIILDDIQWSDKASLQMLEFLLAEPDLTRLLLIATYRSEEVPRDSNDINSDEFRQAAPSFLMRAPEIATNRTYQIDLPPLTLTAVDEFVAAVTKQQTSEETLQLAQVVYEKTGGSPFYILKFLQLLEQDNLLSFSMTTYRWEWQSVVKIREATKILSSDAADIVAACIQKLPRDTLIALSVASCLGSHVPLYVLEAFFHTSQPPQKPHWVHSYSLARGTTIEEVLGPALDKGIMSRSSTSCGYKWCHDSLQKSVYHTLLDETDRGKLHRHLGMLLLSVHNNDLTDCENDARLFLAADQLNRSPLSLLTEENSKKDLAQVNLDAARIAITKSAFYPAAHLLKQAMRLLGGVQEKWERCYDLCLQVHTELMDVLGVVGQRKEQIALIEEVLIHAKSEQDFFRAQRAKVRAATLGRNRNFSKGIQIILQFLAAKEAFPRKPNKAHIWSEWRRLRSELKPSGSLNTLLALPRLEDSAVLHHVALLSDMIRYATLGGEPQLSLLGSLRLLRISRKHGISGHTVFALAMVAQNHRVRGEIQDAIAFTKLGMEMSDIFGYQDGGPDLLHSHTGMYGGTFQLAHPFHVTLDPLIELHKLGLLYGEIEVAFTNVMNYGYTYLCSGLALDPLQKDMEDFGREARQFGTPPSLQIMFPLIRQVVLNLQGRYTKDPCWLVGEAMDQDCVLQSVGGQGKTMTFRDICMFRLMLAYIYCDLDLAAEMIEALCTLSSFVAYPRYHIREVFTGLAAAGLRDRARTRGMSAEARKYNKLVKKILKRFEGNVKQGCVNELPAFSMLQAVVERKADLYEEAIKVCARSGFSHYHAIICECAGRYYIERQDDDNAKYYMEQAVDLYVAWGAIGKKDQLLEAYKFLHLDSKSGHSSDWSSYRRPSKRGGSVGSSFKGRTRHVENIVKQIGDFHSSSQFQVRRSGTRRSA